MAASAVEHALLFLVIGAALGIAGGLFGIGGGLIGIPLLSVVFGLDQQHAQGTSVVMGVPNIALGVWSNMRRGGYDGRTALLLAATAAPLSYLGAHLAIHSAGKGLRPAFGVFLIVIALWLTIFALRPRRAGEERRPVLRPTWWALALIGAFCGALSGFFVVGGAAIAVPFLSTFYGYGQAVAQGLGLAMVVPASLIGLATYAAAGDVEWSIGIPLALGGALCVRYGVRLAYWLPDRALRLLFSGFLVVSAIELFRIA